MSWLTIEDAGPSPSGKTMIWRLREKQGGGLLGVIKWYAAWRKYVFHPPGLTVFEEDCLREIASFCEAKTREHMSKATG